MSVHAVHHDGVLVVSVHGNDSDMLRRLACALEDVVRHGESIAIDLSELTLAPRSSVVPFLEQLAALAETPAAGVVIMADRLSARRVLNRLLRSEKVATAHTLAAALRVLQYREAVARIPPQTRVIGE